MLFFNWNFIWLVLIFFWKKSMSVTSMEWESCCFPPLLVGGPVSSPSSLWRCWWEVLLAILLFCGAHVVWCCGTSCGWCCFPLSFFWKWVLLGGAASPTPLSWRVWCCFFTTLIGGAVFLPLAMGVLLPALGGAVSWIGLWVVLVAGHCGRSRTSGSPKTPSLWCCWFLDCWFFYHGIVFSVAWALALSLSLTLAVVTFLGGAASPSFFWVVLFVAPLLLRVLPLPLGGAVPLTGFWVVSGTDQFGRPKTSGSLVSLVLWLLFLLLLVLCVLFAWVVWPCRCHCLWHLRWLFYVILVSPCLFCVVLFSPSSIWIGAAVKGAVVLWLVLLSHPPLGWCWWCRLHLPHSLTVKKSKVA